MRSNVSSAFSSSSCFCSSLPFNKFCSSIVSCNFLKTYGIKNVALHLSGFSFRDYENDSSVVSEVNSEGMIYFNNLKGKVDFVNSIEPELAQKMYGEQAHKCHSDFLLKAIEIANDCDLKFKVSVLFVTVSSSSSLI